MSHRQRGEILVAVALQRAREGATGRRWLGGGIGPKLGKEAVVRALVDGSRNRLREKSPWIFLMAVVLVGRTQTIGKFSVHALEGVFGSFDVFWNRIVNLAFRE